MIDQNPWSCCYFSVFYYFLHLSCCELCDLCIDLSTNIFVVCVVYLSMFVKCLLNAFAMCFAVVVVFLLNVNMLVFVIVFIYLLERPCIVFQSVCCVCNPHVNLGVPSIYFACICEGSQLLAFLMLYFGCDMFR